jgi:hypothetical protein
MQAYSVASTVQIGSSADTSVDANPCVTTNASGDNDGEHGVASGNGGSSAAFAETQRCITMDVVRTDFDVLESSNLTGESTGAAMPPDTDSAACICITAAAQDALDEVRVTPDAMLADAICCMLQIDIMHPVRPCDGA